MNIAKISTDDGRVHAISSTDPFYELVCIFQRGLKSDDGDGTHRPHKILLHLTGEDLVRVVQLCLTKPPDAGATT